MAVERKSYRVRPVTISPSATHWFSEEVESLESREDPSRFLVFEGGAWREVGKALFANFVEAVLTGLTMFQVAGQLFDLLRMVRIDFGSGKVNSIAWIDLDRRRFFPRRVVDGADPSIKIRAGAALGNGMRKRKREDGKHPEQELAVMMPNMVERMDESDGEVSSKAAESTPTWPASTTVKLHPEDRSYGVVSRLFLASMAKSAPGTVVTAVHRCLHSERRNGGAWKAFHSHVQMTADGRAGMLKSTNVLVAWFGGPVKDIVAAAQYGFVRSNDELLGAAAHGAGLHLSPQNSAYQSSLLAAEDDKGERHIMLCRVIMGQQEKVEAGSRQFHPSSKEYDSGVDDLDNPQWYVVWPANMNTHISPEFIISFRASSSSKNNLLGNARRNPATTDAGAFDKLIAEVGRLLPKSRMQVVRSYYFDYKEGKLTKEKFTGLLRSSIGDEVLKWKMQKVMSYDSE